MQRFDKFTDMARKALANAQEEARRLNNNYIGTEHILLGLTTIKDDCAAVLIDQTVGLKKVRETTEFLATKDNKITSTIIGLTPRAKHAIELAVEEAKALKSQYIETRHLLLGLILETDGIAAGVLDSLGITYTKVREDMEKPAQATVESSAPYASKRKNDKGQLLAASEILTILSSFSLYERKQIIDFVSRSHTLK